MFLPSLTSSPFYPPVPPQRDEDAENLGSFVMFPANGNIDLMYFPYYGKKFHVSSMGGPRVMGPQGEQNP